jgi:hypothetical protein
MVLILVANALASGGSAPRPLTVTELVDSGTVVFLSDGSAWEVRNENRSKLQKWPRNAAISVYRTDDRDWPYRLVARRPVSDVVSVKRLQKVR